MRNTQASIDLRTLSKAQKRAISILRSSAEPLLLDQVPKTAHLDLVGSLVPSRRTYASLARLGLIKISKDRRGRNPVATLVDQIPLQLKKRTTSQRPKGKKSTVINIRPAGDDHQVVTVAAMNNTYRRTPCPKCPWRKDAVGVFPAEAFVHSANTAHDMSTSMFACHQSGTQKSATCAGFLLHGAKHNLAVRIKSLKGLSYADVHDAGHELHTSYREMAIANGVPIDNPALAACR